MAVLVVLALVLLWLRHRSVLDLWLMVVLCAYAIEIALTAFPVPIRFSVGWYAGRVYGVLSGSLVLLFLLEEITMLYGELLRAVRFHFRIALGKREQHADPPHPHPPALLRARTARTGCASRFR
jgi:hypothetical protein